MRAIFVAVAVAAVACDEANTSEGSTSGQTTPASRPAPAPEPEPEPTAAEVMLAVETYEEALRVQDFMGDTVGEPSEGALFFALWSAEKLRWQDVNVAKNETSIKLVNRDSETEIGKRMCYAGRIVQLARDRSFTEATDKPVWQGLFVVGRNELVSFWAAGSAGELVEGSRARLCGVVTGRHAFSNVSGGQTQTVHVVGMFGVPENTGD